jgi:hypothetical protein
VNTFPLSRRNENFVFARRKLHGNQAVFFKQVNGRAALIGFLLGEAVVFWLNAYTNTSFLLYGFIGMLVCVVVGVLLSIFPYFRSTKEQRISI